jgi:hypothetical protein
MYYHRIAEQIITERVKHFPVTALLGPRQCGKSTTIKELFSGNLEFICLDLEKPSDIRKLDEAEWFFQTQRDKLICLDEIQRKPELFPLIRSLVDEWGSNGHFLILGSASRDLLRQSSESLAGRINYIYLTPFLWNEISQEFTLENFLSRGGFPRSLLSGSDDLSFEWRNSFITTFLERDLMLWSGFSPSTMRRLWQMLSHLNGELINYSQLGASLGTSNTTVRNYIDLLSETFMLHILPPYLPNIGKRLVKTPKVYIADPGIAGALIGLRNFNEISGHPTLGSLWESAVLSTLKGNFSDASFYFYRSAHGAEIDILLEHRGKLMAVECKASVSPALSKGTYIAASDNRIDKIIVVSPVTKGWKVNEKTEIVSLSEAVINIRNYLY